MATHDITLPANQRPEFPDRCVDCERPQPGHRARIAVTGASSTVGWKTDVALLAATGSSIQGTNTRVKLQVPCCPGCAKVLERRHFWKTVMLYGGGLLGAVACIVMIYWATNRGYSSNVGVVLGLAILFSFVLAPVIYELRHPPAFTVTPVQGVITYEFRSALCAQEFVSANVADAAPETAEVTAA